MPTEQTGLGGRMSAQEVLSLVTQLMATVTLQATLGLGEGCGTGLTCGGFVGSRSVGRVGFGVGGGRVGGTRDGKAG